VPHEARKGDRRSAQLRTCRARLQILRMLTCLRNFLERPKSYDQARRVILEVQQVFPDLPIAYMLRLTNSLEAETT